MSVPREKLLEMYRMMVLIREFEERAIKLFLAGELPGFLHSQLGQEAIPAGVSASLRKDDYMATTHRGHGDIIAKGADPKFMFAELYARKTGYCKGKGGSMHIADLDLGILGATGIVGGGIPIINGAALAAQLNGTDQVGVCYFGDGASNEGTFHEAANIAALWKLPVLFVIQNNQYAESTPRPKHQAVSDLSVRARAYGFEGFTVDGNDVLAVYDVASKAIKKARKGGGPTLLNCETYRIMGHYVGDPGTLYRQKEEVEEAKKRDPIERYRKKLASDGAIAEKDLKKIDAEIVKQIDEAVEFAKASPEPTAEDLMSDVYCDGRCS